MAPAEINAIARHRLASVSSASADWTRTKAFDEAAAECMRAAEASIFDDTVSEDERNGHRSACNLLAMNFRVMASRAAPEWLTPEPVPATNQAGEVEEKHDCNNFGWCHSPGSCSRHDVATQPATSQEGEKLKDSPNLMLPSLNFGAVISTTPTLREALESSLAKRSVAVMDPTYTAAFNAALDMVARDTAAALAQVKAS